MFAGSWSLLFSTPLYQTTHPDHASLNSALLALIDRERRAQANVISSARSLRGNGWRTDDKFLERREAPIRRLHSFLLEQSQRVAQYGQPEGMRFHLELFGWAVSIGVGGQQIAHVHPHASWSGVYYVRTGATRARGGKGGCLRLTDPRPGAQMVTLGPSDTQFMEAREVCPQPGLLVMFPSWLSHSVQPLEPADDARADAEDGDTRVAVAFNVHGVEHGLPP